MTRRLGMVLIAASTVGMLLASASESQAWGRRHRGNGSCGSWGGNGSGGSFGGLFSRARNGSHGGWGSNGGCGSHGGWGSNGGHGSHGGMYANGGGSHGGAYGQPVEVHAAGGQDGEVRFYGDRLESTPAPAPIVEDQNGSADGVTERPDSGTERQPAPEPPAAPAPLEPNPQDQSPPPPGGADAGAST
jgi:hypothetical protein